MIVTIGALEVAMSNVQPTESTAADTTRAAGAAPDTGQDLIPTADQLAAIEYRETGVRLDERLSEAVVQMACEVDPPASMESIARRAMRAYAAGRGIDLAGGGEETTSRRTAEGLGNLTKRKLWIKYPAVWSEPLDQLLAQTPSQISMAGIWRLAIEEEARRQGKLKAA